MKRVIITGAAGFIGFHVAKIFLKKNWEVLGVDSMSAYYDVELKRRRISILSNNKKFYFKKLKLEHSDKFLSEFRNFSPNIVIHLAAQAGVRYSIDNPKEYVNSNLVGTFNLLEASKEANLDHLMLASTSSVYGANTNMPFREIDRTDHQMSFYAATKKSNEVMSHSYSHLFCIPTTCFRFLVLVLNDSASRFNASTYRRLTITEASGLRHRFNSASVVRTKEVAPLVFPDLLVPAISLYLTISLMPSQIK